MPKILVVYLLWALAIIVFAIFLFWLLGLQVKPRPVRDDAVIVTSTAMAASGSRLVENQAGHYHLTVPSDWYIESSGPTGFILYPGYDPAFGPEPACKIEISVLSNWSNATLGDWLLNYLRQDPTVDMAGISETPIQISGRDAILWIGSINGVSTTAAYISGNNVVYEIVPSAMAAVEDCSSNLDPVLKNFSVIN
ncbi:MAG: hypothetical protein KGJ13_02730 [Patescibacteria group bacterium]|nr:hypothetical protein [Patescibacteria group bacterium]